MTSRKAVLITAIAAGLAAIPVAAQPVRPDLGANFINGGFGEDEVDAMRMRAREFPLRVVFADGPRNEYTANIPVTIADASGNAVFALPDAGPLLYVMLPDGRYTVSAQLDGVTKTQQVTLGRGRSADVVFHWNTQASSYDAAADAR